MERQDKIIEYESNPCVPDIYLKQLLKETNNIEITV